MHFSSPAVNNKLQDTLQGFKVPFLKLRKRQDECGYECRTFHLTCYCTKGDDFWQKYKKKKTIDYHKMMMYLAKWFYHTHPIKFTGYLSSSVRQKTD